MKTCPVCAGPMSAGTTKRRCAACYNRERREVPLADRFWTRVQKASEGCWLWTGWRNSYDYGVFRVEPGMPGPTRQAHRVSWELHNGPIPTGLWVLHRCDNPPCVNPAHLWLGTHNDNMADMVRKGRGQHQQAFGEANPAARLVAADIPVIRSSPLPTNAIARQYGVVPRTIRLIRRGETWADVP